ncbi:MAG: lipoyl synthase [Candidatus ainarchaeum sp.]|nr:lipoyl synthase [Candidatus ainarchaeum sp.]
MRDEPFVKPRIRFVENELTERVGGCGLKSVCQSAHCPNRSECWSHGTATFMILGDLCTRSCRFCAVKAGRPAQPDAEEPAKLAQAIKTLGLKYAVITSVTRDDLPDYGAGQFAACVHALRAAVPGLTIETLVPDFNCDKNSFAKLARAKPDVVSHNLETVERLTPEVRDRRAAYRKSLEVLRAVRSISDKIITKSGIMVGLGETDDEVVRTMADARDAGVELFTIGQYLSPGKGYLPVKEYVSAEKFAEYGRAGYELGFRHVASGPLVRSSYRAAEALR